MAAPMHTTHNGCKIIKKNARTQYARAKIYEMLKKFYEMLQDFTNCNNDYPTCLGQCRSRG